MTRIEADACMTLLTELFPQSDLQPAELDVFREAMMRFDQDAATDAIRNHRLTARFNRPEFKAILADLYERKRKAAPTGERKTAETFADIVRQGNPGWRDKHDFEVLMRYHRYCWIKCGQRESYQAKIAGECRRDLRRAGASEDQAASAAEFIFGSERDWLLAMEDLVLNARSEATDIAEVI